MNISCVELKKYISNINVKNVCGQTELLVFCVETFQSLHVACFAVIFHSENVKYTRLLEQALPFQNKQNYVASSSFGIWTFGQLYSFVLPSVGVLSLLVGSCSEPGTTLLGILPDGYLV